MNETSLVPLPSVRNLLSRSWELYRANAKKFLIILVVPFVVSLVASLLLRPLDDPSVVFPDSLGLLVAGLLLNIIAAIVTIIAEIAIIYSIDDPAKSASEAFRKGLSRFFPFIWVGILTALAVLGGFILLIIPGLIFAVWFSFSYFVLLFEDRRGIAALKQSKHYVQGYFWQVVGRTLALLIVVVITVIVVGLIGSLFGSSGSTILQSLATFLIVPLALAYYYWLYQAIRAAKGDLPMPAEPAPPIPV